MNLISNFQFLISNYLATWWTIMARPIYFYTVIKKESWKNQALSFFLITCWLLAFLAAAVIFLIQYVPIGRTLVEGVSGLKFLIILPVLVTLGATFFLITLLILGAFFVCAFFALFGLVAVVLRYVSDWLGGEGRLEDILQNCLYSSAALLWLVLVFLLMLLTKADWLSFGLFATGFNFIVCLMVLYLYGLWAVAVRKIHGLSKAKSFAAALGPVLVMLILQFIFDKIALSKFESWIT